MARPHARLAAPPPGRGSWTSRTVFDVPVDLRLAAGFRRQVLDYPRHTRAGRISAGSRRAQPSVNAGRIVAEACLDSGRLLEDLAAVARSRPLPVVLPAGRATPARYPARQQRASANRPRRPGRWLVLHASHLASTSGSQIAVITEPATRAELEPVIAAG
jgi:hypothetical protein